VARWRLPSVEISGLRFDAQGFLYVNTTTKGQEQARYSEQIDLSRKDHTLIVKVDPKTGTVLWRAANCGHVVATTGNFLYASETAVGSGAAMIGGQAQLLLYRLNPKSGKVLWEFAKGGGALGLDFSQNAIQLLTPTELQVLSYVAF
jgi:outer membrane protein assembly factor BamB